MCKQNRSLVCNQTAHAGTDLILLYFCLLWKIYGVFFLLPKRRKHKTGTYLDLNKASPSFLATALRKTRSMCNQKRSLVFIQSAHAGTDLDLNKASPSFSAKR